MESSGEKLLQLGLAMRTEWLQHYSSLLQPELDMQSGFLEAFPVNYTEDGWAYQLPDAAILEIQEHNSILNFLSWPFMFEEPVEQREQDKAQPAAQAGRISGEFNVTSQRPGSQPGATGPHTTGGQGPFKDFAQQSESRVVRNVSGEAPPSVSPEWMAPDLPGFSRPDEPIKAETDVNGQPDFSTLESVRNPVYRDEPDMLEKDDTRQGHPGQFHDHPVEFPMFEDLSQDLADGGTRPAAFGTIKGMSQLNEWLQAYPFTPEPDVRADENRNLERELHETLLPFAGNGPEWPNTTSLVHPSNEVGGTPVQDTTDSLMIRNSAIPIAAYPADQPDMQKPAGLAASRPGEPDTMNEMNDYTAAVQRLGADDLLQEFQARLYQEYKRYYGR